MDWKLLFDIIVVIGSILGTISYIKSFRKPRARLRFTNEKKEITFFPRFCRPVSEKYYKIPWPKVHDSHVYEELTKKYNEKIEAENEFTLSFRLSNTGRLQLENYRVEIDYDEGIQEIGVRANSPLAIQEFIEHTFSQDGVSLNIGNHQIIYEPEDKRPLNQKDFHDIAVRFSPNPNVEKFVLNWRISAKDFSNYGKLIVHLKPKVDEYNVVNIVLREDEIPEGAEKVDDLTPYIKEFEDLLKE